MPTYEKRPAHSVDLKTAIAKPTAGVDNGSEHPAPSAGRLEPSQGGGSVSALSAVFSAAFGDAHQAQHRDQPPPGSVPTPSPGLAPTPSPGPAPAPTNPSGALANQQPPQLVPHCPPPAQRTPEQQKQLDAALAVAQDKLSYGVFDWQITDKDARTALGALRGLPPDLRSVALDKLDPTSFSRLLQEVPDGERTQFKELIASCADPTRKLQLFAAYHKSHVQADAAERERVEGTTPKTQQARTAIVEETAREVDAESAFLLQQVQQGKLTPAQLDQYMIRKESEHQTEMKSGKSQAGTLDGLPSEQRVDYVKQQTESLLSYGLTDWMLTDAEARKSLTLLTGLPPSEQSQAVKNLTPKAFSRLLQELPEDAREQLKPLVDSVDDPSLKLQLYGVYHKGQIRSDAAREKEKTAVTGGGDGKGSTKPEADRLNQRRDEIIKTTDQEIDEEVAFLLAKQTDGKPVTMAEVQGLMHRKDHEHQIEMKYNVNLTNDIQQGNTTDPSKMPTDRAVWKDTELDQLDYGLGRLPSDHVKGNTNLSEIRRTAMYRQWDKDKGEWVDSPGTGGYANPVDHSVHITETGASGAPWRTPATSALARHKLGGTGQESPLSLMEEVITHEIGHNVHQQNSAMFEQYQKAAGWERLDQAALKERLMAPQPRGAGLSQQKAEEKLTLLEANREADYGSRPSVDSQDNEYRVDPYGDGKYLGLEKGSVPTGGDWDYARSNPEDHFAEHYAKAIHAPESLYADLRANPEGELAAAKKNRDDLLKPGSGASDEQKKAAEADFQRAQHNQKSRYEQWRIMREDVFHLSQTEVDKKTAAFTAKLPPDKLALANEFKQKAAKCMTPQQFHDLEAEYDGKH